MTATYRNHGHYISEGWAREPKESFKELARLLDGRLPREARLLDVGCATGELIGYLSALYPALSCTGMDVFEELLSEGRRLVPGAEFVLASAIDMPPSMHGAFDVVTAIGCMSIFDETRIEAFWSNLLLAAKPSGLIVVLAPLNEYGVDTMIRHRKREAGVPGPWETGWNVFSRETIEALLAGMQRSCTISRFAPDLHLEPRADPVRTWTLSTEKNPRQLTNGMKLLIDHYFITVQNRAAGPSERR